ncbi:MAG TPA: sulfite exporter TauE/SafE family protein [Stellaceae bacterium]|nr:sulfite exporter TauE/SafE family protein [Stellaceae bacterium]
MSSSAIIAIALGAAAGGFVQGLAGFAFGLIALGVWAWTLSPALAGSLVVFGSLLGQLLSLGAVRHALEARRLWPFIAGGLCGVPIGVALLNHIDPPAFKLVVGVILLVWCPTMLLLRNLPRITSGGRWADAGAGWVGGVMGGLGGLTGPAPVLWCALRGWERDTQRAVFQVFNLAMQGVTLAAYIATGTVGGANLWAFAIVAPAMALPTLVGARLYRRFSDAGFRRLILLLLIGAGAILAGSGLSELL